ncbi:MAG: multidrug transporter, partial [candidate division Zixibacteria bacterium]|nr:multidrug transporter [Gammaproteobacteria bacterium]NIX55370.1 multidrug transporter [candidate division Zixibacteria bacterium]
MELDAHTYSFSRKELLELNEFNTGIFAFRGEPLYKFIHHLEANNAQGELYVTDLIKIFNDHHRTVLGTQARKNRDVIGFNNKSVLKEMNSLYKREAYEKLKDIIALRDPDDFFLNDEMVEGLIEL